MPSKLAGFPVPRSIAALPAGRVKNPRASRVPSVGVVAARSPGWFRTQLASAEMLPPSETMARLPKSLQMAFRAALACGGEVPKPNRLLASWKGGAVAWMKSTGAGARSVLPRSVVLLSGASTMAWQPLAASSCELWMRELPAPARLNAHPTIPELLPA